MQSRERGGLGYYVAAGVLILAAGSFFLLAGLLVRAPASEAVFLTGPGVPSPCNGATKHATCYQVSVTNTGTKAAVLTCVLQPAPGTNATFFSGGQATYVSTKAIEPGFPVPLLLVVKGKQPNVPIVICSPSAS